MLFSKATSLPLEDAVARYLPAVKTAGHFLAGKGLSGASFRIETLSGDFNARKVSSEPIPGLSLHRYQRVLRRLAPDIGPSPYCLAQGWLFTRWLDGQPWEDEISAVMLADILGRLHHQRLFGWRISLAPLLTYYWQNSPPGRRTHLWLKQLNALLKRGEPKPLRLAPLHMDVHRGNLIVTPQGVRLIDWEYAGDGDVALELAAVLMGGEVDGAALLTHYAQRSQIAPEILARQIHRWKPWIALLSASWYECRLKQTQKQHFAELADNAWQEIKRDQENIWVR